MARKKQTKIKAFKVFKGDIAYNIVEELEKKKIDFSELMRRLLISEFVNKKEFKQAKINRLLSQRKELKSQIPKISDELKIKEKQLKRLGYELKDLE